MNAPGRSPWMGYYLSHEVLGLPRKNLRELADLVRLADWRVVIQNLSFLATVESYYRNSGGEPIDDMVARQCMKATLRDQALKQIERGGVLVNKFSLALVATAAIRLGEEKLGEGKLRPRETLGEILLTANDIATSGDGNAGSPEGLATTIRNASLSSGENAFSRLIRYYLLLTEIPDSLRGVRGWRDLSAMFLSSKGFEVDKLLSLGFGIYSYYSALGDKLNQRWRSQQEIPAPKANEWILDSKSFLKNSRVPQEAAQRLMLALSTTPKRFQDNPTRPDRPFDFAHLKTWPMVNLGDTRFCVPVLDFLVDRLTIRAYFDIIDPLPDKEKEAFGGFFGLVVERYVHMLLEEMFGRAAGLVGRWFKPENYQRSKGSPEGPDAIIIDNEGGTLVAIFLEVKSSRPDRDAATSGDLSKLRDNWNFLLIGNAEKPKAARQLDRAISDFRNGDLRLPGLDASLIAKVYPVILTLDPWPFYLEVHSEFLKDVAASKLFSGSGIAPLDVWSCFDLELLSPQIIAGRSLMDIIKRRPNGADHIPLWSQISAGSKKPNPTSPLLTATLNRMLDRIVTDLKLTDS